MIDKVMNEQKLELGSIACYYLNEMFKVIIDHARSHNKKLNRFITFLEDYSLKIKPGSMKNIFLLLALLINSISFGQSWTKQYDCVNEASSGVAKVSKNHKYGFVDIKGKVIVPLKYDDALSFSEGMAAVGIGGKWGFVDSTGKEVIPLEYTEALSFVEGLAVVGKGDVYGFIDKNGKMVISQEYTNAKSFAQGIAPVCNRKNRWGYIDKSGKEVIGFQFQYADAFKDELARVMKEGKWFTIDKSGTIVSEK